MGNEERRVYRNSLISLMAAYSFSAVCVYGEGVVFIVTPTKGRENRCLQGRKRFVRGAACLVSFGWEGFRSLKGFYR